MDRNAMSASSRAHAPLRGARVIVRDPARPTPQLVVLGAGLDGRAWRTAELADVEVFEMD